MANGKIERIKAYLAEITVQWKTGAPDMLVRTNAVTHAPIGYVETKDIDDGDLDGNGKNKEQFDRYKADLDNIIFALLETAKLTAQLS